MQPSPCLRRERRVGGHPEQAQRHIGERRHEDVGRGLRVQAPAAFGASRDLEMPDHASGLGRRHRAPQERAQDDVLREDHRAPYDLALEAAVRTLQRPQPVDRPRSAEIDVLRGRNRASPRAGGLRAALDRSDRVRRHLVPHRLYGAGPSAN